MSDPTPDSPTPLHRLHIWQFQAVRDVLWIAAVWGLLVLGYYLNSVTVPILIALGLAYMFEPLVRKVTSLHKSFTRTRVVTATLAGIVGAIVLIVTLVMPLIYKQTRDFVRNRAKYAATLHRVAENPDTPVFMREYIDNAAQFISETVDDPHTESTTVSTKGTTVVVDPAKPLTQQDVRLIVAEELAKQKANAPPDDAISSTLGRVLKWAGGFALSMIELAMTLFLIGFFFFFFSTTYPDVVTALRGFVPSANRERFEELSGKMDLAVSGFVRGRITIVCALALVFAIGWTICGVPYGLLLGLLVGLSTIVPYLAGVGLIGAYGLLILKLQGTPGDTIYHQMLADGTLAIVWWRVALYPFIVFGLAQILDDYILTPAIQGPATNLSTPMIVVAVIAGGSLAGLYGMLLAIPAAACLRILATDVFWPKVKLWLQGRRSDPLPLSR
jgi:predicted PurR-regulated permease PerM